ncbi:MAG: hypothetical protein AAF547_05445 [Actinomycetota bacterium]
MTRRSFTFRVHDEKAALVRRAGDLAAGAGARFVGDDAAGSFSHRGVTGEYLVAGDLVTVKVDKPLGIPWGPVERALDQFFEPEGGR